MMLRRALPALLLLLPFAASAHVKWFEAYEVSAESGRDPALRRLAEHIIRSQQEEIGLMQGSPHAAASDAGGHSGGH